MVSMTEFYPLAADAVAGLTGAALDDNRLTPNHTVRAFAQRFCDECRAAGIDPHSL